MRRGSWSLRRRLAATIAVIGLALAVVVGSSVVLLHDVRSRQARVVDDYFGALTLSEQQFTYLVSVETAVRGYALTHDPKTLEPVSDVAGSPKTTRQLRADLADDTSTLAALDRAQASAARWYTQWAQPSIAALDDGAQMSSADVLEGEVLFARLRADFRSYLATLETQRDHARHRLDVATNLLFAAVVTSAVVAGLAVPALWFLLLRWVVTPVAALAAETRVVGAGGLDQPVTGSGPDELLALSGDVESMRRRLVRQIAHAEATAVELQAARALAERSSEELARSNRNLEQFAYVASHDLQEPLRKVASFCQLLQKRYGGQLDDRADQYIGFAVDGAKRIQQLINDLLAFSRVGCSDGAAEGHPAPAADLGAALDRARLALSTAIHITADRGERNGQPVWEFACADNGIGIEPQYAERVFVIFQRLHAKELYGGTGIGLAMCKRIVEFHGGEIWVDPTAGEGTTVRWTLPVQDSTPVDERRADDGG